ncbi:MAG: FAD-dependent monooxygenase [Pseudonocardiales bacterium]|nr:FAD-dependent monooxygenase [Pseudonocardiales bacterium]
MSDKGPEIAIVGAGIGGLTLGLALRERGVEAEVFEAATELTEIGAAVAQSANATRLLARLGLADQLVAAATTPTELIYRRWNDGRRVAAQPVSKDSWYLRRFGSPYYGIHRADLQRILIEAFGHTHLHLGSQLGSVREDSGRVRLEFGGGRVEHADIVVGVDGIRSVVRRWVTGSNGDDVVYSGTSGFRGIVAADRLPSLPDPQAIQFWMGPNAHLLHYAIGPDGGAVNFLAVEEGPSVWPAARSVVPVEPGEHLRPFEGWHPAVLEMIDAVPCPGRWGLFVLRPPLRWYRGNVVLAGDAAHAMLPHHGQGANTTIEDAFTLAELLTDGSDADLPTKLQNYQRLRRARTRQIARSSWVTNDLLHLPDGPEADARDRRLAEVGQRFAWIHEFDAIDAVRDRGVTSAAAEAAQN